MPLRDSPENSQCGLYYAVCVLTSSCVCIFRHDYYSAIGIKCLRDLTKNGDEVLRRVPGLCAHDHQQSVCQKHCCACPNTCQHLRQHPLQASKLSPMDLLPMRSFSVAHIADARALCVSFTSLSAPCINSIFVMWSCLQCSRLAERCGLGSIQILNYEMLSCPYMAASSLSVDMPIKEMEEAPTV